jgi:hypothetical protein
MKRNIEHRNNRDIRPEYDFSSMKGGVRGKYYEQYRKGSNIVVLEHDVAEAFPTESAVNEALRGILKRTRSTGGAKRRVRGSTR